MEWFKLTEKLRRKYFGKEFSMFTYVFAIISFIATFGCIRTLFAEGFMWRYLIGGVILAVVSFGSILNILSGKRTKKALKADDNAVLFAFVPITDYYAKERVDLKTDEVESAKDCTVTVLLDLEERTFKVNESEFYKIIKYEEAVIVRNFVDATEQDSIFPKSDVE